MKKLFLGAAVALAMTNAYAVDALGSAGLFSENETTFGWTLYTQNYSYLSSTGSVVNSKTHYGTMELECDPDFGCGLKFWSNGQSGQESYYVQASYPMVMERGYSYTIKTGFTAFDAGRLVNMGVVQSGEPYMLYFDGTFKGVKGEYAEFESETYEHCGATDEDVKFFVDAGITEGGFNLAWVSVDKQKIDCGSSSTGGGSTDAPAVELNGDRIGPVSQYGRLQAGKLGTQGRIFGSCPEWQNEPVQVRGMSLFWSIDENAAPFYTEAAVDAMVKNMKIEVIRFAMGTGTEDWGGFAAGYKADPDGQLAKLDVIVKAAIKNDIYVIIDWHSHTAHTETSLATEFFETVSKKYGKYNNVIFEIYNEPAAVNATTTAWGSGSDFTSWSTIKTYANTVISAIRKNSDNLIIVGTPMWSSDFSSVTAINDKNVAYTFHYYASEHTISGKGSSAVSAINKGLPVFVTEWGTCEASGNGTVSASANSDWQDWLDKYDLSSANWSAAMKDESCSAFSTSAGSYGSLMSGYYYTYSGNMVKGFLDKNPSKYTACSNAVEGSGTSKDDDDDDDSPKSSSSSKGSSSSKAVEVKIATDWNSDNTYFESESASKVVIGDLDGDGKRSVTLEVEVKAGQTYTIQYYASTDEDDISLTTKVYDEDGEKIISKSATLTSKRKLYTYVFKATTDVVNITLQASSETGDVTVDGFKLYKGDTTPIVKFADKKSYVALNGDMLNIAVSNGTGLKVQLFDMMGNVVMNKILSNSHDHQISLKKIARGNYVVKVSGNGFASMNTRINLK